MRSIISSTAIGHGIINATWVSAGATFGSDAILGVHSVSPQANGNVDLKIHIDWDSDLHYKVTLFIDP